MESTTSTFNQNQMSNEALVVLSEAAASGLHEVLRNQRPMQHRLPDPKDFHNMSLMSNYSSHLLHNFPPQLLQSFNPSLSGNFFANERLMSKSMLSNFQFSSAFAPPKYIGIPIDQNIFSGCESYRTDSTSPTCTSQDSLEGPNEYDCDKSGSPRSNSDPKDGRPFHSTPPKHGNRSSYDTNRGTYDFCPVCGMQLSPDDWNSHFLTELDRLYKLSIGADRSHFNTESYQLNETLLRSKHNRWETFQRIQNNRQGRFKIKVRKRKYGRDLFFMENLFCRSCPICRRKFALDSDRDMEDDVKVKEDQTIDLENNCECVTGSEMNATPRKPESLNFTTPAESDDCVSASNNLWDVNLYNQEKNKTEMPSTTQQYADSCEEQSNSNSNDSDEDIIVDDDICKPVIKKSRFDEPIRNSNQPQNTEDSHSEPQVTSSEETNTNTNNNNRESPPDGMTKLPKNDNPTNTDISEANDYKCFICLRRPNFVSGIKTAPQQCCTHT